MSRLYELPGQTTLSRVVAVYEDVDRQIPYEYVSRASYNSSFLIQRGIIKHPYRSFAKRIVFVETEEDVIILQKDSSVMFIIVPNELIAKITNKEKCVSHQIISDQFTNVIRVNPTNEMIALLMASAIGITDFIVSWDLTTFIDLGIFPNIHQFSKETFDEFFPKSYWIVNFIKLRNFDDRRVCLSKMTDMIQTPKSHSKIDEIVIIGDPMFTNAERFRYDAIIHTPTTFVTTGAGSGPFWGATMMVEWAQKNTIPGSIVVLARQDVYFRRDGGSHLVFQRIERGRVYTINGIVIPDIPDPRPELVGRGNPLLAGAMLIRFHDEVMSFGETRLSKIGMFDHQVFAALSYEFMKKRYLVGNLSVSLNIYQAKSTQMFSGKESESLNRVSKTDITVLPVSNKIFPKIVDERVLTDFNGKPFFTRDTLYETLTLKNMANKQLTRKGRTYWNLKEESHTIPSTTISICDINETFLVDSAVVSTKKRFIYDSWKKGISVNGFSLSRRYVPVPGDVIVIPKSSPETYFNVINTFTFIIAQILSSKHSNFYIDIQDDVYTNIPIWKECMEGSPFFKIDRVDLEKVGLIGSPGSRIVMYPTEQSSVGFIPALVRKANELVYEAYSRRMELKADLFKEIVDKDDSNQKTEKSSPKKLGIIFGEEWVSTLDKLCKKYRPDVEWRQYVHGGDIHLDEMVNVKYAVGTSTGSAWILGMFLDPKQASVIEIAKEHEYDPKWYHLSSSVGCNHAVLPLKTEPTKQCVERIKKQLSVYFDELDKTLPSSSPST